MSDDTEHEIYSNGESSDSELPSIPEILASSPQSSSPIQVDNVAASLLAHESSESDQLPDDESNPTSDQGQGSSRGSTKTASENREKPAAVKDDDVIISPPAESVHASPKGLPASQSQKNWNSEPSHISNADKTAVSASLAKSDVNTGDIDDLYADPLPPEPKIKKKKRKAVDGADPISVRPSSHKKLCPASPTRGSISAPPPRKAKPKPTFMSASQPPSAIHAKLKSILEQPTKKDIAPPSASQPPEPLRETRPPAQSQPVSSLRPRKRTRIEHLGASSSPICVPSSPPAEPATNEPALRKNSLTRTTRSQVFWHLDGSVVILVQKMLFKLHRSLLALQSAVFADMFHSGLSKGKRKSPTVYSDDEENKVQDNITGSDSDGLLDGMIVDSCPVYKVTAVSAEDFEVLLKGLESGLALVIKPPSFPELASLLRASHALKCDTIRSYASNRLSALWPAELSQLTANPSDDQRMHATETLALSHRCEVPEVRKRAVYELLRSDGFGQKPVEDLIAEDEKQGCTNELGRLDLLRLISAREYLQRAWIRITRAPPTPSVVPCPLEQITADALSPSQEPALKQCRDAHAKSVEQWTTEVTQATLFEEGMRDPLCALTDLCEKDWKGMGYCVGCVEGRLDLWDEERDRLWSELDRWLELGFTHPSVTKKNP